MLGLTVALIILGAAVSVLAIHQLFSAAEEVSGTPLPDGVLSVVEAVQAMRQTTMQGVDTLTQWVHRTIHTEESPMTFTRVERVAAYCHDVGQAAIPLAHAVFSHGLAHCRAFAAAVAARAGIPALEKVVLMSAPLAVTYLYMILIFHQKWRLGLKLHVGAVCLLLIAAAVAIAQDSSNGANMNMMKNSHAHASSAFSSVFSLSRMWGSGASSAQTATTEPSHRLIFDRLISAANFNVANFYGLIKESRHRYHTTLCRS